MAIATTALSMKLLVDTKAQRVVFAEASKDVVDFLFSLLTLPIATAVKLLGKESMPGCVGNLYGSVEKLDDTYVQPGAAKGAVLRPAVLSPPAVSSNGSLLRLPAPSRAPPKRLSKRLFICSNYLPSCHKYVTGVSGTKCPCCGRGMTEALQYQYVAPMSGGSGLVKGAATGGAKGLVQGVVTYTVTDNLTVSPMSAISSITLLNTFAVRDLGALQERTVQLGSKEGLAILKASLQSKTVLTDVFLAKKRRMHA